MLRLRRQPFTVLVGRFGSPSLLSDGSEEELGAAELVSASSWLEEALEEMEEDEEEEEHGGSGSFFFLTFLMTPVLHLDFLGRL